MISIYTLKEIRRRLYALFIGAKILPYSVYRSLILARSAKRKKLSFCITHMSRFAQLSRTLPENLESNREFERDVEFVLVNFIIDEKGRKTDRWIREKFGDEIRSGYLRYFVTDKLPTFHAPKAKNTAHVNATGLFLMNLDADNFITPEEIRTLLNMKGLFGTVVHLWNGVYRDGTYGGLGLGAYEFHQLRGYNEFLGPYTFQEKDLINRYLAFVRRKVFSITESNVPIEDYYHPSHLKMLRNFPRPKPPLPNPLDILSSFGLGTVSDDPQALEARRCRENLSNYEMSVKLTGYYTRPLKQSGMGVAAVRVTGDDLGGVV